MKPPKTPDNLRFHYANLHEAAKAGKLKYDRATLDRENLLHMLAVTDPRVAQKSFDVRIVRRFYETGRDEGFKRVRRKYPVVYNQVRAYTKDMSKTGSGDQHRCIIRFFGPPDERTPCWVWCDCAYFTFTSEYALTKHNSSDIKNSNGEPATVRNKPNHPMLCKHLYRVADWALNLKEDKARVLFEKEEAANNKAAHTTHTASTPSPVPGRRFRR